MSSSILTFYGNIAAYGFGKIAALADTSYALEHFLHCLLKYTHKLWVLDRSY